jgi:integrase
MCNIIGGELKKYFESQKGNPMELTQEKANELLKKHLVDLFLKIQKIFSRKVYTNAEERNDALALCTENLNEFSDAANTNDMGLAQGDVAEILKDNSFSSVPEDSTEFLYMCRKLLKGMFYLTKSKEHMILGDFSDKPQTIIDQVFPEDVVPIAEVKTVAVVSASPAGNSRKFGELVDLYCKNKIGDKAWGLKTQRTAKATFDLVREYFKDDTPIAEINHEKLVNFKTELLLKLPSNHKKHKIFDGKSLEEITKDTTIDKLAPKTVNERISMVSSFFKWCALYDYIPKNPAQSLMITDNSLPYEKRDPYSKEDLTKLMLEIKALPPEKLSYYWIVLIALFSGMRQNEICQLYLEDIKSLDDIFCFDVNRNLDKSLKNKFSRRIVPISPVLIEIGFLEYVEKIRASKSPRLFPDLKKDRDGKYAEKFQKFFYRFNRNKITKNEKCDFHSLRHNFANSLKQQGVYQLTINELLGHEPDKSCTNVYTQPYLYKPRLEAIEKLNYEIDVPTLLGIKAKIPISKKVAKIKKTPEKGAERKKYVILKKIPQQIEC